MVMTVDRLSTMEKTLIVSPKSGSGHIYLDVTLLLSRSMFC